MFKEGLSYKFSELGFNAFQCASPVAVNRKIAAFIGDKAFEVVEVRGGQEVIKIRIQGVDYTLMDIVGNHGYILDKGEFCYFVEVSPEVEELKAETQGRIPKDKFCVFVITPGATGYLIRNRSETIEQATAFGEQWLKDNPEAEIVIAEGLLNMSAQEQIVINTSDF